MGDKGSLVLVNGTPYTWQLTLVHSYQLTQWDASFPRTIAPFAAAAITVQRADSVFRDRTQDGGEASYTLLTNSANQPIFQVQARADGGQPFRLQVLLQNFAAQNTPLGSVVKVGWVVGGQVNYVLAGSATSTGGAGSGFVCNNPPEAWMQANMALLGGRTLRQICMPGSHDAGISMRSAGTTGAFDCNILTQTAGIGAQLSAGVRYFDLRPVIAGGQFSTGHYSLLEVAGRKSWQGANGQSFASIVADLNAFTSRCAELIILNVSHELNTDLGNASYASFTQTEWDRFLGYLQTNVHNLYIAPGGVNVDLSSQTVRSFIGAGRAAVLVMFAPSDGANVTLSAQFAGRGFYKYNQLNAYDRYSNTNDLAGMTSDQLTKMRAQRPTPNNAFFLLSWTLTQNATQAATCFLGTASSILELAAKANPTLFSTFFPACTSSCFPNVLYLDDCADPTHTALAMAVNNLMGAGKTMPSPSVAMDVVVAAAPEGELERHRRPHRQQQHQVVFSAYSIEERLRSHHTYDDDHVVEQTTSHVRLENRTTTSVGVKKVDEHRARIAEIRANKKR